MEKARSMRVFSNNREDSSFGLRSQWDYVGRHAADRFSLVFLSNCPVDSLRRYSVA